MRNVYLITYHRAFSYGAFLQAFALQLYLKERGVNSEFIDYRPKRFSYKESLNVSGNFLVRLVKFFPSFIAKTRMYLMTNRFCNRFLETTKKRYNNYFELESDFLNDNSIFISGSDQIWDTRYTNNRYEYLPYFLGFTKGVKLAYSSSCGEMNFKKSREQKETRELLSLLKDFKKISVRENKSVSDLNSCDSSLNVKFMIDPTVLIEPDVWRTFYKKRHCHSKKSYLLIYNLNRNKELKQYAKKLAKSLNIGIVNICDYFDFYFGGKNKFFINPFKLLRLIDESEAVVTDSFHGTIFSFLFNKRVHIFLPPISQERLLNLCEVFNCEDRIVFDKSRVLNNEMQFDSINKTISELQKESLDYFEDFFTEYV